MSKKNLEQAADRLDERLHNSDQPEVEGHRLHDDQQSEGRFFGTDQPEVEGHRLHDSQQSDEKLFNPEDGS